MRLFCMANYFLNLALVDVNMNKWQPSLLASASIYVAKRISDVEVCWNKLLEDETNFKLAEIKLCARDICMILSQASLRKSFKAVFTKFSHARYLGVARFCQQISENKRPAIVGS